MDSEPENPLTARVTVNRMWNELFGAGLVETTEDFGIMGQRPSNPQLLDWLAVEFRESGWDMKHMYKLMVMSAAYRQSAKSTPEQLARDPKNLLLAHGPRFRMDAEMLRDIALQSSGLLVNKIGGTSVRRINLPTFGSPSDTPRAIPPNISRTMERRSTGAASIPTGSEWRWRRIWMLSTPRRGTRLAPAGSEPTPRCRHW